MDDAFDLVVIGSGSAGSTVASRCSSRGWKVAVVDSRPFGGTCALRGCNPKKVLVGGSELADWTRRFHRQGIVRERMQLDWTALMRFKRTFTDPVPVSREKSFKEAGIETLHGRARFVSPEEVIVGDRRLRARRFAVTAGARPVDLPIEGQDLLTTSDRFLELDRLPPRIVFIGGGYISFEFAHVAARAGARATILHRGDRALRRFDPDLVDRLIARSREAGIEIHLEAEVKSIERSEAGLLIRTSSPRASGELKADMAVHGAGRIPDIDDMNLAAAGVESGRKGVVVNLYLQSVSNPAVYAGGDAADAGPPLTPVAGRDGSIIAENLLDGNRRMADYSGVPTVVFTTPPLAAVGLREHEAREKGLRFRTNHQETSGWYTARRVAEECSGFKVLIEEGSGRILGAHLLGPHAEEVINIFALAIRAGIGVEVLADALFSYPTASSDVSYML